MGFILSKFRRAKPSLEDSLEKIDKDLTDIRRFQIDTEVQQKRIIGRLSISAYLLYIFAILAYYLFIHTESFTWSQFILSLLPFIVFPLLVWVVRRTFGWWYQRKIVINKEKSDTLRKERERLLDEVMDKETFKVAKKILEKYAPSHLLPKYLADQQRSAPGTPIRPQQAGDALRRRTIGGGPIGMRPHFTPMGQGPRPGFQYGRPPFMRQPLAITGGPGTPQFRGTTPAMSSVPTGFTPMRYMIPQTPSAPVLHNRKTGWLDKLVDYVVADGPTHRFALICRYCATHNGLATPDDFPYTGYRCIYCRQFNPPKQQRPSAATLPRNTVLIEEMDTTMDTTIKEPSESGGDGDSETERTTEPGEEITMSPSRSINETEMSENLDDQQEKEEEEVTNDTIPFADEDGEEEEEETQSGKLTINLRSNSPNAKAQDKSEHEKITDQITPSYLEESSTSELDKLDFEIAQRPSLSLDNQKTPTLNESDDLEVFKNN